MACQRPGVEDQATSFAVLGEESPSGLLPPPADYLGTGQRYREGGGRGGGPTLCRASCLSALAFLRPRHEEEGVGRFLAGSSSVTQQALVLHCGWTSPAKTFRTVRPATLLF